MKYKQIVIDDIYRIKYAGRHVYPVTIIRKLEAIELIKNYHKSGSTITYSEALRMISMPSEWAPVPLLRW